MDAVAALLVGEALKGVPDLGLPNGGVAEDAVTSLHASRYKQPPQGDDLRHIRMGARNAFGIFKDCISLLGEINSHGEAVRFSLPLNASLEADGDLLTALTPRLFASFVTKRSDKAFEATKHCLAFVDHHDTERLLENLRSVGRVA
jgi:hypothetical protein